MSRRQSEQNRDRLIRHAERALRLQNPQASYMDSGRTAPHTEAMNDITREELDAKLAANEARMDARLERFDKDMRQVVSDFRLEVQPLKSLKANIWSSTAFIIASVIAVASLSFGAFDSGRETSKLVEEAKQQAAENRKLLEQIDSKLRSIPAQPSGFQGTERTEKTPAP